MHDSLAVRLLYNRLWLCLRSLNFPDSPTDLIQRCRQTVGLLFEHRQLLLAASTGNRGYGTGFRRLRRR